MLKRETLSWAFTKFALKGSEIARNVAKVSLYACLLKWVHKSTFKFHFLKSQQKWIFPAFVWPSLNECQNSSKSHKNRCPCLFLKWLSKSTLKFEFFRKWKKCNVLGLGLTKFDRGPKWLTIPKKSTCRDYLSNRVPKYSFKFQFRES